MTISPTCLDRWILDMVPWVKEHNEFAGRSFAIAMDFNRIVCRTPNYRLVERLHVLCFRAQCSTHDANCHTTTVALPLDL